MLVTSTLQGRFTLLIALIILAVGVAFGAAYSGWLWQKEKELAADSAQASLEAALPAVARASWNLDETGIRKTLNGIAKLPTVHSVWFSTASQGQLNAIVAPSASVSGSVEADLKQPVIYSIDDNMRRRIGELYLKIDFARARDRTIMLVGGLTALLFIMMVLIAFAARRVFNNVVTRPVHAISEYLLREDLLSSAPVLDLESPYNDDANELGQLQHAINRMVSARRADVAQLRDYRDHLAEKVEERTQLLKATQNELIQAEKLAALGSLVAGVSHELNTPIGNGLMLASTLSEKAPAVADKVRGPGITREELQTFLDETAEATDMITRTLTRARDLVQDFKTVAVDRQSAKRRQFRLNDCIEETVATIRPSLKRSRYEIRLELGDDVQMDGYPGAVSQIISNLVDNAVRHAFDGSDSGTITIRTTSTQDARTSIEVADDGAGMSPTQQRRLFDPFYTTKLGQGGSGLGMAIVHRLIHETLDGEVEVTSSPGHGTSITLILPQTAPGDAQTATEIATAGEIFSEAQTGADAWTS